MENKSNIYYIAAIVVFTLFCDVLAGSDSDEIKVIVERNVPVPMRDGTILRADVYRPDRGGPYPVLVQRTMYGKNGRNFDRFVKAGYIVVCQDIRGMYESEGEANPSFLSYWENSERDGYDTVEWAAKLPDSSHKVGTFGASALAREQYTLASLNPPSLVVMSAQRVPCSIHDYFRTGTIRPQSYLYGRSINFLPNWRRRMNRPGVHTRWEATILWKKDSKKWINFLPWLDIPLEVFWIDKADAIIFEDPNFDPDKRIIEYCPNISVPNLEITGWYDFTNGDMRLFRTMTTKAKTEVARKGSKIVIGPWVHSRLVRKVGTIDFGPAATLDDIAAQIRWFDYWLKGIQNGVDEAPAVVIFVMGDNKWQIEQSWPLQRAREKIFFIVSQGNANTPSGEGKLITQEPGEVVKDQYLYDPKDPVPSLLDAGTLLMPVDQRPLAGRKDILVYQTEPLVERVEITGDPVVELYAASSAPDTDWFVRLIDVAPEGLARDVSNGVVRARYRKGFDSPEFITPGEVVKYTIRMMPTSNAFLPGHRIRLDITSSDFPNYDRNHNTAANQNADATLVVAQQAVYSGGAHASRILLPWIPNPAEKEKPAEEKKVEQKPEKYIYPFHQAVVDGDTEQIKLLISQGVNVDAEDQEKKTPLHYAAQTGKLEVVQLLVEAGANVNTMGKNEWPPLCIAVENNHISIAKYLIAHGADINPDNGWTPLQEAVGRNNVEMVELLLAKGANINAGPWTALHDAARNGQTSMVKLLIEKGADVNAKDDQGRAPLSLAIKQDNKDIAELLIVAGADFTSKDDRGLTILHNTAVENQPNIAELLLSKGINVNEKDDNYEFTALHYAARFGSTKVAKVLIAHDADVRAKDKWGYEPIHWAAYHDLAEIIELLIAKGADVNIKTSLGKTPLELAIPMRNTGAIEVLRKHGAKE